MRGSLSKGFDSLYTFGGMGGVADGALLGIAERVDTGGWATDRRGYIACRR